MKKIDSIIFSLLRKPETGVMMSARSPGVGGGGGGNGKVTSLRLCTFRVSA